MESGEIHGTYLPSVREGLARGPGLILRFPLNGGDCN